MPLKGGRPGRSEFSSGKGNWANPDSDYQSQRKLAWETADRDGGSKRGGLPGGLRLQLQRRMDSTVINETEEDMLTAYGNPDTSIPDTPLIEEAPMKPSGLYRQPNIRTGVFRQK